ncbi:hypothetical protein HU200_033634 [Digitaria exilis]|uniref:At2g35280-like TPR domain-containing protein n=1 Tax=Digitaria exilis TaxID=1010633 RepID=A0A835EN91_9POAL|nr:hypothetical protein HU200_033634 [Digitaria exilis]
MASMELPRSLVKLPNEILALIAGQVTTTSTRPMKDLRSLRATCKAMHHPCRDRDVGRCLALQRVRVKQMQEEDPAGYDVFARSLAACGNLEACFLTWMDGIFGRNRSPRPPLEQLHRAATAGHRTAAYVAAVFLYRANNGNDTNATAMEYMKQVEFEDGLKWRPRFIPNAYTMDIRPYAVKLALRSRRFALVLGLLRPMLPPVVVRGNVDQCLGRVFSGREPSRGYFCRHFCSDECRLRFECLEFFYRVKNHIIYD